MRSILDMRLGPLSLPRSASPHLHEGADFGGGGDDDEEEGEDAQLATALLRVAFEMNADVDADCCEDVDAFGIPIPSRRRDLTCVRSVLFDDDDMSEFSMPMRKDSACSVLLAESPSRLDLSALLC